MEGMLLHAMFTITALLSNQILRTTSEENLALKKPASQTSDVLPSNNGNDGNKNAMLPGGSCTLTVAETDPWWRVDLLVPYNVTSVSVTNRQDCCPERLDGVELRIGNSPLWSHNPRCVRISHIPAGRTFDFQCGEMEGRYVILIIPGEQKILTLCEVGVYGSSKEYNLLRGLKAFQSSLWWQFDDSSVSRVIDGSRLSNFASCMCTAAEENPWLRVELPALYRVTAVALTNRGDCCPERLNGAEIRVGNSLENNGNNNPRCATVATIPAGASYSFYCVGMLGRYVNIVNPGTNRFLTLCEVDVFGVSAENVALKASASQSSDWDPVVSPAKNAIDGNPNPNYNSGSCSHTLGEANPWWRVNLGRVFRVSVVTITNRDVAPEKMIGAEICIGNSPDNDCSTSSRCSVIDITPAGLPHSFFCSQLEGQYITIFNAGTSKHICLCEVEVYGVPTDVFYTTVAPAISTTSPAPPPPSTPPPTPPPPPPAPSASLVLREGRTVTVVGTRLCWSDALFYCRDRNWDLLSLRSQEEQKEVEGLLGSMGFPLTPHLWMGLRRTFTGHTWFWMTGDLMSYSQWKDGYAPMYANPCGSVTNGKDFLWNDRDCGEHLNFLCYSGSGDGAQRSDYYSTARDRRR